MSVQSSSSPPGNCLALVPTPTSVNEPEVHVAAPAADRARVASHVASPLDRNAFPHIFDLIISYCPPSTLWILRGLSTDLRSRLEPVVWNHVVVARESDSPVPTVAPEFTPLGKRLKASWTMKCLTPDEVITEEEYRTTVRPVEWDHEDHDADQSLHASAMCVPRHVSPAIVDLATAIAPPGAMALQSSFGGQDIVLRLHLIYSARLDKEPIPPGVLPVGQFGPPQDVLDAIQSLSLFKDIRFVATTPRAPTDDWNVETLVFFAPAIAAKCCSNIDQVPVRRLVVNAAYASNTLYGALGCLPTLTSQCKDIVVILHRSNAVFPTPTDPTTVKEHFVAFLYFITEIYAEITIVGFDETLPLDSFQLDIPSGPIRGIFRHFILRSAEALLEDPAWVNSVVDRMTFFTRAEYREYVGEEQWRAETEP